MEFIDNVEKISLFKRFKIALFDLEKYISFLVENFSKCLFFVFKISILLSIIFAVFNISYVFIKYGSIDNFIDEGIPDFSVIDGKIIINETENSEDNQKENKEIIEQINENVNLDFVKNGYNKSDLKSDINNNLTYILAVGFISIMFANFIDLVLFWLANSILTAIVGEVILMVSHIRMKFLSIYSLAIYATTLSTILTVVYSIARMYFNIYIDIFDYLYMIISFIYITAVILMIKTELVKRQIEVIKVVSKRVQKEENIDDRVKEEKEPKKDDKREENDEKKKEPVRR